ncbi:MAG: N-acetyl sugar amidotransferase, partial [Bacteroidota bacterium]
MSYQICSRCVMDTSDIEITFDDKGVCNHCTEFFEKRIFYKYQGEKTDVEFLGMIEKIKKSGRGKEYDCVIGISGGVDSSYAVWIAKKVGLRVLGVHMDNGWNSEEAVLNIKSIADR